ncbi:MAG TPA: serine/threonine-protein kinase [Thermoanaerobaculia bacterium]|nr:serine/threonine-protein kinase [Thermoanaerobaculia bacterium]
MPAIQENTLLGPYRIAGMIGEGGMGAVYRAQDTRLGRDVAIKILTNVTLSDRERLVRFEQEARTTGMLNHPNLLTIYDVGNADGTPYLVSELLQGETLRDRLNRGPVAPRKVVEISLAIAAGLAAAHEKAIVHRDLKPENIFLTKEGRVKILDFGIAKLSAVAGGDGPTFKQAATEPGMVLGTVGYMSPEQVRGENIDARSDIFALGAIMYEMLTGHRAFKHETPIETLSAILKEDPQDMADVTNVPSALDRLVRRCMEKDREQRFQSARDLAFNLETMSAHGTLSNIANPSMTHTAARTSTVRASVPTSALPAASATATMTQMRTRAAMYKAKHRTSKILLALLYVVTAAGAVVGGWKLHQRKIEAEKTEVTFRRVTFRRGEVRGARFTPDGDTIVYSAAWEGRPSEIYVASRQSPEARPLGVADADLLGVAKSTELAILLHRDRLTGLGTLARVPIAGGMPREIANNVQEADWSSDGSQLAAIRVVNGKYRVEYPVGNVKYETLHDLRGLRVAPDGSRVAFIDPHDGAYDIVTIAGGKAEAVARGWSHGANGLAWSRDSKEIWITGTDSGAPPALYAVPLDGEPRVVSRLTGSMKLFDISPAGRVLMANGLWRAGLFYKSAADANERDMSWLDWSILADLSDDAKTILFNETREGGGGKNAIYLRKIDAPTPVHMGEGYGDALSPNGNWILAHVGPKLMLLPTGAGDARDVKVAGSFDLGAEFLPDSKRFVIGGALPKENYRLLLIDTLDETVTPLSPENIWSPNTLRPFAVSGDGRTVAGMTAEQTIALYAVDGAVAPVAMPGVEKGEVPIEWTPDGSALYVYRPTALPAHVFKVNVTTGARELWKEFSPVDPAGVYKIAPVLMTRDAGGYAYNALRTTSDLYVAEGLK